MMNRSTLVNSILACLAVCLSACVSPPFVSKGVTKELRPVDVVSRSSGQSASAPQSDAHQTASIETADDPGEVSKVMWGGVVIGGSNTGSRTEIEIISYPLDYLQRPDDSSSSTGRFLAVIDGYLETADFPAGSRVTALGTLGGTENGKIGETEYRYAVLKLAVPQDLHRWRPSDYYNSSPIGIGIGISISN